jgi:putative sugar O-methyltransferase
MTTTTISAAKEADQVEDDLGLLDLMLADLAAAEPVYQPTNYWASYVEPVLTELRGGLRDFRRNATMLSTFGGCDTPPTFGRLEVPDEWTAAVRTVTNAFDNVLAQGAPILPEGLSLVDLFELALFMCRMQNVRLPKLVAVDELDVSRVGNPFGYDVGGRFLTRDALFHYMRYAYVGEFVDLDSVDVVVELGGGAGKQAEVLKRLHPRLTIVLLDLAPQLYVAERFLSAALPDEVVPYRETRGSGAPALEPGKIHFLGNFRIADLESRPRTLFWTAASMGEMEPEVVAHYARAVTPLADWLYLNQCFTGKERAGEIPVGGVLEPVCWPHYVRAFAEHWPCDRRPAHTGLSWLTQGARSYEDSFWRRRS